jgi:HD-GYP domain-containing protein (c-di-GMP phosphodiesterase class II)
VGHVHRVGTYAYEIGLRLGLPPADLRDVVLAAQMHDIGKLNTPDAILFKPAGLTDDELHEMRKHAARSGEIAGHVRALRAVAHAVRSHHERFTGGGYPDGIAGDAIPLIARIVSVADTYDAMTTNRPYRQAMSHEAAIAELRRVRGTQLDPVCVDAFVSWWAEQDSAAA